jgi:hypothetical protein
MTRDALEAAIRRHITIITTTAIRNGRTTPSEINGAVESLLNCADAYSDFGDTPRLTRQRREAAALDAARWRR